MIFVWLASCLLRAASRNHILVMWQDLLNDYCRETRKVSEARTTSTHFPVLRYYAIFASRCLIGRGVSGCLSAPDLAIYDMLYFVINLSA